MHKTSENWRNFAIQKQHLSTNSGEYFDQSFSSNCSNIANKVPIRDCNQTFIEGARIGNHLPIIELKGTNKKFRVDIANIKDKHISFISNNKRLKAAAISLARVKKSEHGKSIPCRRGRQDSSEEDRHNVKKLNMNGIHFEVREKTDQKDSEWHLQNKRSKEMNLQFYNFNLFNDRADSESPKPPNNRFPANERCTNSKGSRAYQNKTSMNFYMRKNHNKEADSPIERASDANSLSNINSIKESTLEEESDLFSSEVDTLANKEISPLTPITNNSILICVTMI